MKQSIAYIRSELEGIYSQREIDEFISLIFDFLLGYSRADIIIYKSNILSESLTNEIRRFTLRLKMHEPIQYILGNAYFMGMKFYVAPGVLIPRPETEELVDLIYQENHKPNLKILDIGTGSGCIAISLSKIMTDASVSAFDISDDALKIAKENNLKNNAGVQFVKQDILNFNPTLYPDRFDIIVSNPPYICNSEKETMDANVLDHEPELALFVDDSDPLLFYRTIAIHGRTLLKQGGKLYFEINQKYGNETASMLKQQGYDNIEIIKDIYINDRIVKATYNG